MTTSCTSPLLQPGHLGSYGLKGLYALEEYDARDLTAYYRALSVGPSHNYYMGAEVDITGWVSYFIAGMAASFEKVRDQAIREAGTESRDQSHLLRNLDARQRKALALFKESREVSAKEIAGAVPLPSAHGDSALPAMGGAGISGHDKSFPENAPVSARRCV
jgi:hypothetical protein